MADAAMSNDCVAIDNKNGDDDDDDDDNAL